jgi:hypothetical protein
MSFQITILKVLAGHPEGRASLADLKRAMAILITSGSDWTDRMKRLAARAPDLDIFSQSFVLRDNAGWQITDAGRAFLEAHPVQKRHERQSARQAKEGIELQNRSRRRVTGKTCRDRKRQGAPHHEAARLYQDLNGGRYQKGYPRRQRVVGLHEVFRRRVGRDGDRDRRHQRS